MEFNVLEHIVEGLRLGLYILGVMAPVGAVILLFMLIAAMADSRRP